MVEDMQINDAVTVGGFMRASSGVRLSAPPQYLSQRNSNLGITAQMACSIYSVRITSRF